MLIRTIDELDALPEGAVVLDDGEAGSKRGEYFVFADNTGLPRGTAVYMKPWQLQTSLPLTLIHPRRYGDDDVERAAKAHYEWARKDRDYAPWENTDTITQDLYRRIAHTTLNALEDQ